MSPGADGRAIFDRITTEVWNDGDVDVVDELFAPDFVSHRFSQGEFHGPDEYKRWVRECREAFPDLRVTFEHVASGDVSCGVYSVAGTQEGRLEGTYLDVEPTGRSIQYSGLTIIRVEDGRVVEEWALDDANAMLGQLGVFPDVSDS